jgi:glycerol 2-dehydrogenase (NADP+)
VQKAVSFAISAGYRHIDCAFAYGNEEEVGLGLKDSLASGKIKRGELFVTTKLWCTYHTRVEENLDLSLQRLGLDYVDLYLMHWPIAMNPNGRSSFLLIMPRYIALSVRRTPKFIRSLIQERPSTSQLSFSTSL